MWRGFCTYVVQTVYMLYIKYLMDNGHSYFSTLGKNKTEVDYKDSDYLLKKTIIQMVNSL